MTRPIQVEIDDLDRTGAGVGWPGGVEEPRPRVHVAGALPGELVLATEKHRSPHRSQIWANLLSVERASSERQAPTCSAFGACGGCALGHYKPRAQAQWKETALRKLVVDVGLDATLVKPIVESDQSIGYRNQSKLVVARQPDGGLVVGGFAPRSHAIVDLVDCRLVEPALAAVTALLPSRIAGSRIAVYDEGTQQGELRYVLLRANRPGEVLITLVTRTEEVKHLDDLVKVLAQLPGVFGVVQSINPNPGNALYGLQHIVRWGRDRFVETIADGELEVSFRSFFQINRDIADRMWRTARAIAQSRPVARLVDVYCGVGGFGLAIAGRARLFGIEVVREAIDNATANAARAGINATYLLGDAAARLAEIDGADLVLLNPPRRGCDPGVLAAIAKLGAARIFYMSCDAQTLVRDLVRLRAHGFSATQILPFDMMPHTPHFETLTVLEANSPQR